MIRKNKWNLSLWIGKNGSGIYAIQNIINGKMYIGSSKNIRNRLHQHLSTLRRGCNGNKRLQKDWNDFGVSAFRFVILFKCYPEDLLKTEQRILNLLHPAYNIAPIAGSTGFLLGYNPFTKKFLCTKIINKT